MTAINHVSAAQSATRTTAAVTQAEDFSSAWKTIFERARPVETLVAGATRTDSSAQRPGREPAAEDAAPATGRATPSRTVFAGIAPPGERRGAAGSQLALRGETTSSNVETAVAPAFASPRVPAIAGQRVPVTILAAPLFAGRLMQAPRAPIADPAPESVSVFVDGVAVGIVVRNMVLPEEHALRCAFETAQRLTGERAALQVLTLNGRTVYRRAASRVSPPDAFASRIHPRQ
jgi:hypothetical protein